LIFGWDAKWVATGILALVYLAIMTERMNRSVIALLGAGAMILAGVLDQAEAIHGIDFNTIALLTGMMVIVSIARRSGMFEYLAIWSAKQGRAEPWAMIAILSVTTAVVSAFLDNVTTVLLIAPVTLALTRQLGTPPYPFLFSEVLASNIGGTATLIGDPPNIIIGSAAGLSFNDFAHDLTPIILVVLVVHVITIHLIWGRQLHASETERARVLAMDPREQITDRKLLRYSLVVIAGVILAFVFAQQLKLEAGTIALMGAAILMLMHNIEHHNEKEKQHLKVTETYNEVDWITIFFFVGLFVVVHGVEAAGVLQAFADWLIGTTGGQLDTTAYAILWASALLSAIVDNIPFVATMIPVIKAMGPTFGDGGLLPLWWALSLGACLGGNGTLIGASANLTVAGIAERAGVEFSFITYTKYAVGMMLLHVAICHVYLWLFWV
jgi:Na+/H+ antiporter NhaD/arsenite permease-like protein